MGWSHKVTFRLFSMTERQRRFSQLPPHYRALASKNSFLSHFDDIRAKRSVYIGLALLLHLCCLGIHVRVLPGSKLPLMPLAALFSSFLSVVRLLMWIDERNEKNSITNIYPNGVSKWTRIFNYVKSGTKRRLLKLEQTYLKMRNFALLINQLVFFSLCERVFLTRRQPITSFYTLMFYNVFAYCISYIKELIQREDWSVYIKIAKGSNMRHLAMSATNIVLEWTKAIAFIMTIVFILLVCGLEKGLKNYTPNAAYLAVTAVYFILSEKVFVDLIFQGIDLLKLGCFESMENMYSPLILKGIQIILSLALTITCGMLGYVRITCLAAFTNIRSKYKELDVEHWQPLRRELISLICFRNANWDEIRQHDDVCAVCLTPMKSARITPCQHFFHAECLRRCLAEASLQCPMCKQELPRKYVDPSW